MSCRAVLGGAASAAALALVSPVLMALLHQHQLSGTRCRPLDVGRLVEDHLDAFLRAYATG